MEQLLSTSLMIVVLVLIFIGLAGTIIATMGVFLEIIEDMLDVMEQRKGGK